jgi:hypothetical protein
MAPSPTAAMIAAMLARDVLAATATWRPQLFGDRRAATIEDPIIEPLWTGPRVLALVTGGTARLTDVEGEEIPGHDPVRRAIASAVDGATVVIEAALTPDPLQGPEDLVAREEVRLPNPGRAMTQMVLGDRGGRKDRLADRVDEARRRTVAPLLEVALVAVDLLWLDDESLLDVPLLERKRILESVIAESELVRLGTYVRTPIDSWLGAWRAFGFTRMTYKSANSRYVPGAKNQAWAHAEIPRR